MSSKRSWAGRSLIIAVVFLAFAYSSSNAGKVNGYLVTAKFGNVSGINPGSDVRLSGIKVGSVVDTSLDPQDYSALVNLSIKDSVKLPTDTLGAHPERWALGLELSRSAARRR